MRTLILSFLFLAFFAGCKKENIIDDGTSPGPTSDNKAVGAAARALLASDTYKSLRIELLYMTGFTPDAGAVTHLQNFLAARLNKPSGITISLREIPAAANTTLTLQDVYALETAHRTFKTAGDSISVYILYTNGQYTENNVLGIAYRNTSVTLFGKKLRDNSGGVGQASRTKLEATVLEHEIGHLLGLVDLGTPMKTAHKDTGHDAHCNNSTCLMYYAAETTDILGLLITGNIPALDANCIADLQGNGGK